jgi:hypothetical protein
MSIVGACMYKETFEEKLACVLTDIKQTPDADTRATFWHKFASFITIAFKGAAADGKFDITDVFIIVGAAYKEFIQKKD